jgi:hypothetical protein
MKRPETWKAITFAKHYVLIEEVYMHVHVRCILHMSFFFYHLDANA